MASSEKFMRFPKESDVKNVKYFAVWLNYSKDYYIVSCEFRKELRYLWSSLKKEINSKFFIVLL